MVHCLVHLVTALALTLAWFAGSRIARRVTPYTNGPQPLRVHAAIVVATIVCVALLNTSYVMAFGLAALVCAAAVDALTGVVLLALPLLALIGAVVIRPWHAFDAAVVALPFALAAWKSKGLGVGWGDVAIAACAGALAGAWAGGIACMFAVFAAIGIVSRRDEKLVPFAPLLVAACSLAAACMTRVA